MLCSKDTPNVRVVSVDIYEQEIAPGGRSAKHLHMTDEVAYVLSGTGESLQLEVEAEIAERFYARVAKEPTRWESKTDDTLYVPQNHIHQYVTPATSRCKSWLRRTVCQVPRLRQHRVLRGCARVQRRP